MKTSSITSRSAVSPTRMVSIGAGSDVTTYGGAEILCGLYIGSTGAVQVDDAEGNTVIFVGVPTGQVLAGRFTKVYSTNTDASSILGYQE